MKRGLVLGSLIVVTLCAVSGEPSNAKQGRVVQTLPKPKPKPQLPSPAQPSKPPEPPRPSLITEPEWSRRPSGEDLARYYPEEAQRQEREGRATINCMVKANGTLEGCTIVSEDPAGLGFGDATVRASRLFRMRPQTKDGQPVDGGTVRLPLVWKLPQDLEGPSTVESSAPTVSITSYVESLGGSATCGEFSSVAAGVQDARPLIANAARQSKGEFETSEEFVARYSRGIMTSIGGARMLVLRLPMSGRDLNYNADKGVFTANSFGVASAINSLACASAYCSPLSASVEWKLGSYYSQNLEFVVPRDVAGAVKASSTLVVGFLADKITVGKEAYGEGIDVTINGRCAMLVSGEAAYPATSAFWFDRSKPRGR